MILFSTSSASCATRSDNEGNSVLNSSSPKESMYSSSLASFVLLQILDAFTCWFVPILSAPLIGDCVFSYAPRLVRDVIASSLIPSANQMTASLRNSLIEIFNCAAVSSAFCFSLNGRVNLFLVLRPSCPL